MSGTFQAGPPADQAAPLGAPVSRLVQVYAGFWWRVLAWMIDSVILALADELIARLTGLPSPSLTYGSSSERIEPGAGGIANIAYSVTINNTQHLHHQGDWMALISLLLGAAYFVLLESSRWQATVGKRVCRIRVVDLAGRRIGPGRALGRYLGKFVSAAVLMIGFLMAGWTLRKQALHDIMARTLVMRLRVSDPVFTFQQPVS